MKIKRNFIVSIFALLLFLCCGVLFSSQSGDLKNISAEAFAEDEIVVENDKDTDLFDFNEDNLEDSETNFSSTSSFVAYGIYIDGEEVTSSKTSDKYWSYDTKNNILILDNYTNSNCKIGGNSINFLGADAYAYIYIKSSTISSLTIRFAGGKICGFGNVSYINQIKSDGKCWYGIYAPGVDLTISLSDKSGFAMYSNRHTIVCKNLTIKGEGKGCDVGTYSCIGNAISCTNLTIDNVNLFAISNNGNNLYRTHYGENYVSTLNVSGTLSINDSFVSTQLNDFAPKTGNDWKVAEINNFVIYTQNLSVTNSTLKSEITYFADVTSTTVLTYGIYVDAFTTLNDGSKLSSQIIPKNKLPSDAELYSYCCYNNINILGDITLEGKIDLTNSTKKYKDSLVLNIYEHPCLIKEESKTAQEYKLSTTMSALYVRESNGKYEYSTDYKLSSFTSLYNNTLNMSEYAKISKNVFVISGDWTIVPIADSSLSMSCVALGGNVDIILNGGKTYGTFNLNVSNGKTISVNGNGIVNSLTVQGCSSTGSTQGAVTFGKIIFNDGTVKSGSINGSISAYFYGGNINVDYYSNLSNPMNKYIFDFSDYVGLLDFKKDIVYSGTYGVSGIYPLDGKVYCWDNYSTTARVYRRLKYAMVKPTNSYVYYLYPSSIDENNTYKMYRLTETDVFNKNTTNVYILTAGETLTLEAGSFAKKVTRPATEFGGSSTDEILSGSETTACPDNLKIKWSSIDTNGNVTTLDSKLNLTINAKATIDNYVYSFTVSDGKTQVGEYRATIYVFDYNSLGLMPQITGKDESATFTFSFDSHTGYNNWIANHYDFIWQIDKNGDGNFVDIAGTENKTSFSVKVESDESYNSLYRVKCYSSDYYSITPALKYPTFYTITAKLTYRELPYFNGQFSDEYQDYAGATKYFSISLKNCYLSCVSVWYEYSEDDGLTWKKALDNPAFDNGVDIILAIKYLSPYGNSNATDHWYPSKGINLTFSTEMNGWKLRCVMQTGDYYVYSNTATISVLNLAGFTTQPESTVLTSSDSLNLIAEFEEYYVDEENNGISNIKYQWLREEWSYDYGSYGASQILDGMTTNTLNYENVNGFSSVARYRLKVTFTYKEKEYTRYSSYAEVYVLYNPTIGDDGIVINNLEDKIYNVGGNLSYEVKDNGYNYNLIKTYQWQISKDDGTSWQDVGQLFTQSRDNTTFVFNLNNLKVSDGGLYRCKISITKGNVTVSSYSNLVNVGVISEVTIGGNPKNLTIKGTEELVLSVEHQYSENLTVLYQWQGYDVNLGWVSNFQENNQSMNLYGLTLMNYEKYRCLITYKLDEDIQTDIYTDAVEPAFVEIPEIPSTSNSQVIWLGDRATFTSTFNSMKTENYTIVWELSKDNGSSWEAISNPVKSEIGKLEYSLNLSATSFDFNGALLRCSVSNTINNVSETVTTDAVTLTIKSGYVKTEEELFEALEMKMTEFKLLDDIVISKTILIDFDITLDLNGHILSYKNEQSFGSVIKVTENAQLVIIDSLPDFEHLDKNLPLGGIISGGTGSLKNSDDGITYGGGIFIESGKLIFNGGTIYECVATYGGGVYSAGNIDIKDGCIIKCLTNENDVNSSLKSDALYLYNATLNAYGGRIDGTVTLENSLVDLPDLSVDTTEFLKDVYCVESKIKGGFYYAELINPDISESVEVKFMKGNQLVVKLFIAYNKKAISYSYLNEENMLLHWYNGDEVYDFDEYVNENLVLNAKWFVSSDVSDKLTDDLDKSKMELDKTNEKLNSANENINKLNSKLKSVTALMIVFISLFVLTGGAVVYFVVIFYRKKKVIK